MLIGQVSELTGATRKAIRHYESIGLMPIQTRSENYRIYSDHDVMVIRMIRRAQTLGFSLNELKDIVSKKLIDEKLPMALVYSLINQKILALEQEMEALHSKVKNLSQFKIDLFEILN